MPEPDSTAVIPTYTPPAPNVPVNCPASHPIHWPSVLQIGFSLLAILSFWGMAFSLFVVITAQKFNPPVATISPQSLALTAAGFLLCGFLLLPSALYALARLINRPAWKGTFHTSPTRLVFIALCVPVLFWLGNIISRDGKLSGVFLPIIHLLSIGLPVLLLIALGRWGLQSETPQRAWGIFASGMVLGPLIIMVVETLALLGVVLLLAIWAYTQPDLADKLVQVVHQLKSGGENPATMLSSLSTYITRPPVLFTVLAFGAVLVPLIEEAIKPIGVWLLVDRLRTPQAGFAAGILSGAGYALFESLALANNSEDWLYVTFGRLGAGVIHIAATALVSWALVAAWQKGSYLRLGLAYVTAVLFHGLWNGLTITAALISLPQAYLGSLSPLLVRTGEVAPYGLAVLTLTAFTVLLLANRLSQQASRSEVAPTAASTPLTN